MTQNNTIGIDYTDAQLRVLVEEYITRQRSTFSLQGVCNYVLYWAMEEGHTTLADNVLYDSNKLAIADCERVKCLLEQIIKEGRLADDGGKFVNFMNYVSF